MDNKRDKIKHVGCIPPLSPYYRSFSWKKPFTHRSTRILLISDAHTSATEVRDKEQQASFFPLLTISTMASLQDVEDGKAEPSSTEFSTAVTSPTPSVLKHSGSNTFFSRLSGRLRRSFYLSSNKRERSITSLASNEVGVIEVVRPSSSHESEEVRFCSIVN